jgi:hypothetical protein
MAVSHFLCKLAISLKNICKINAILIFKIMLRLKVCHLGNIQLSQTKQGVE